MQPPARAVLWCCVGWQAVDWWSVGILLYEMLAGFPPFRARGRQALQKQILAGKFRLEKYFSGPATSLLKGLLQRDAARRLGARGSAEVLQHAFFRPIDWVRPPRLPAASRGRRRPFTQELCCSGPSATPSSRQGHTQSPRERVTSCPLQGKLQRREIPSPFRPSVQSELSVENFDKVGLPLWLLPGNTQRLSFARPPRRGTASAGLLPPCYLHGSHSPPSSAADLDRLEAGGLAVWDAKRQGVRACLPHLRGLQL